jgi:hypothetical protein
MEKYNLDEKGGLFKFTAKSPVKIVKNGEAIDLKHFSVFDPVQASVLDVAESTVTVQAKAKVSDFKAAAGDHVILHYRASGDFFVINGEIASIDSTDPLKITVKVVKIEKLKDIVKEKRCCVSLQGFFKIIGVSDARTAPVKCMSLGGIKANCREDIMLEDMVDVTVQIDKLNKMVFKGRIVRKNKLGDCFEYGVEYSEVPESSSKLVHHMLYQYENLT